MAKSSEPNKWTFIVFRDNRHPALQFKLNRTFVVGLPLFLFCLILISSLFLLDYFQMAREHQQFASQLEEKQSVIKSLQKEFIRLSYQTEEIQGKIASLETLEKEIELLSGNLNSIAVDEVSWAEEGNNSVKPASLPERSEQSFREHDRLDGATGGEQYSVSPEEMQALATAVESHLDRMQKEIPSFTEKLEGVQAKVNTYHEMLRVTPSVWPTVSRRVTSTFGYRQDPFTGKKSFHTGIDIGGKIGAPVYATADGKVTAAGYNRSRGYYVTIDHTNGIKTTYMHLKETLVEAGNEVRRDDLVGLIGSTGRSSGPHLHYEVLKNNKPVDPLPFMSLEGKKPEGGQ